MKKLVFILVIFSLIGCMDLIQPPVNNEPIGKVSIISPLGIPYLAVAPLKANPNIQMENVSGTENLQAALVGKTYDIVIAPINLGAKLYNAGKSSYKLVAPITYNNSYIVARSHLPLASIDDLIGQKVIAFGEMGIPGSVLKKIYTDNSKLDIANVDYTLKSSANVYASFLGEGNNDSYALMSEPEISKLKVIKKIDVKTLDLCSVLGANVPQAAVFVNPDSNLKDVDAVLKIIEDNIKSLNDNPTSYADKVLAIDEHFFSSIGREVIIDMIPNASIKYGVQTVKEDCANILAILGISGVADEFYYQKA